MLNKENIRNWLLRHPQLNPYNLSSDNFFRFISSRWRLLPDFIIIGFPKAGTTSLYHYLIQHPNVGASTEKELDFFNFSYWRGMSWYRTRFPTIFEKKKIEKITGTKFVVGEASPLYVYHPLVPQRIKQNLPNVKLIVILRNPIDRAYSHHQQNLRRGWDTMKFEEAIHEDEKRFQYMNEKFLHGLRNYEKFEMPAPVVSIGKYYKFLEKWMETFPKNQFLIIEDIDLEEKLDLTLKKIFNFLEIEEHKIKDIKKMNTGKYQKINEQTYENLKKMYKPYNEKLENLLKMKFNW